MENLLGEGLLNLFPSPPPPTQNNTLLAFLTAMEKMFPFGKKGECQFEKKGSLRGIVSLLPSADPLLKGGSCRKDIHDNVSHLMWTTVNCTLGSKPRFPLIKWS